MNSKHVGTIGEEIAIVELLKLGAQISRPLGDNSRYDLIIDIDEILYTCQVKTTLSSTDTCAKFYLQSSQAHRGKGKLHYYTDCIILVDLKYNKTFCIPGKLEKTSINIRYTESDTKNQYETNYANNLILTKERLLACV